MAQQLGGAQNLTVNVNALSNAFATALQQATSSSRPCPPSRQNTAGNNQSVTQSARPQQSASVVLPSYLRRKRSSGGTQPARKAPRVVDYDRDIVCLPDEFESSSISFPRGKYRARLAASGLIGKIHLKTSMTVEEVKSEIRSVFSQPMGERKDFPFVYLQSTGGGNRTLIVPPFSPSFQWTAQQVAKLGGSNQAIYIMAKAPLIEATESETESEDEGGSCQAKKEDSGTPPDNKPAADLSKRPGSNSSNGKSSGPGVQLTSESATYSTFVDIVDLTDLPDDDDDSVGSLTDDLPSVAVELGLKEPEIPHPSQVDPIVGKHALLQHQKSVITGKDEEDLQRVCVRRRNLFGDTVQAFSKPHFNVSKMLKVRFIGEQSVDTGGPRREFFRLVMKEAFCTSGLFVGWPCNVVPTHDIAAVAANKYYVVGKMMTTCLIQGGQPPVCLARCVAEYIVFDEIRCQPNIDDISDMDVRQGLMQLNDAKSDEEVQSIVEKQLSCRFECGYSKPTQRIGLSNKQEVIKALWLHHVFFYPHAELDQLKKGFRETLEMERLVCLYPHNVVEFLEHSKSFDVTAEFLLDSFVVEYSLQGSNSRTPEEAIILSWNEYVDECSRQDKPTVSLPNILQFFSGSSKLPACGFFDTPGIRFTSEDCFPRASTCDLSITFSRSWGLLSYEEFKVKMDRAILESAGFGRA